MSLIQRAFHASHFFDTRPQLNRGVHPLQISGAPLRYGLGPRVDLGLLGRFFGFTF